MSKTGLELLEEISERLDLLTRRFEVIEHNTKQILSRMSIVDNKTITKEIVKDAKSINKEVGVKELEKKEGPTITQTTQPQPNLLEHTLNENTRVMGKLKKENKVLSGVIVKILNRENSLVRETKTNRAGEWQCFLTPGDYKAEYFLENMINSEVKFTVTPDQQLLRVQAPPQ